MTPGSIAGMMAGMNDSTKTTPAVRNPDRDPALPPYAPSYDEAALDRFAEKGREAWRDVPDAAAWVREIRGHNDE